MCTSSNVLAGEQQFRKSAQSAGVRIGAHDLGDAKECARAVEACVSHFGGLDVLVNNAGVTALRLWMPWATSAISASTR